MAKYFDSPFGPAEYIHVNKPDLGPPGKNAIPAFKVDLRLSGAVALKMKEDVDAACEAAHEAFKETDDFKKMKPKDQRELGVFRPYEIDEDDDGNPTGDIIFHFRQNATIKLRGDGGTKAIKIGIYDSEDNEMSATVGRGSVVRVRYSTRGIKAPSTPPAYGVRLDFAAVQVKELKAGGSGGARGFGKVDGGYVSDGSQEDEAPASDADGSADY